MISGQRVTLAVGVDLIEVDRIADAVARFADHILERIYTDAERQITGDDPSRLAGRFAVKEACSKALGTGIGTVRWRDIECLRDATGKPVLVLHGAGRERAEELGWQAADVSISTTRRNAVAMVVALAVFAEDPPA
jgi:holo-[acyl-carrier protein] synthase